MALYSSSHEKILIVADFNACMKEFCMSTSCYKESLIKDANCPRTDLVSFHRMVLTGMKISLKRLKPSVMNHTDYYSPKKMFWEELLYELSKVTSEENANVVEEFIEIMLEKL